MGHSRGAVGRDRTREPRQIMIADSGHPARAFAVVNVKDAYVHSRGLNCLRDRSATPS
jgi:hypothetical protein